MRISKKLEITDFSQTVTTFDNLIRQLQCYFFSRAIKPSLYRSLFSRWALQTLLLHKVLNFLHYIEIPNKDQESIYEILEYLAQNDRSIPEIWLWIGEHEKLSTVHSNIINTIRIGDEVSLSISNLPYLWILNENYENIAHEAVHINKIDLLRSLSLLRNADQINQRNIDMNSPCHLAILQEKFDLVTILTNSPNIDLTVRDKNHRTPLHLLLFLALQKARKTKQIVEKQISSILCHMLSRDNSLFFLTDCQGNTPIDYSLLLGSISVVSSIFSHHMIPPIQDITPYFYQSIRLNQPSLVNYFVHLYLNCDTVITLLNTQDVYGKVLSDILCFCIINNYLKSLLVLLSKKQFICSINSFTSSCYRSNHTQLPLHFAIDAMKFEGRMEPFRILNKFNAHLNSYTREVHKSTPCFSLQKPICLHSYLRYLRDIDYSDSFHHDNFFSYICSLPALHPNQYSLLEQNAISLLREIFSKNSAIKCYFPNKNRKYQAGEILERNQRENSIDLLSFFCNSFFFQCNPLVTLILSSQSNKTRYPPWIPYHQHSHTFTLNQIPFGYHLLEYLLLHTPFIELINIQESRSCLTPLAAACAVGNKFFIELLCRYHARPYMKLNASYLSKINIFINKSPLSRF